MVKQSVSKHGGTCDICQQQFVAGSTVATFVSVYRHTVGPCCNGTNDGVWLEIAGDTCRVFAAFRKEYVGHITRHGQDCYGYRRDHSRKQFHTAIEGGAALRNAARWVAGLV